jgi:enolase
MSKIVTIESLEILDSRGFPTIETLVKLDSGITGVAMVPSGASTGTLEAHELRDADSNRYLGKGVKKAISNIKEIILPKIKGLDSLNQQELDRIMIELDGTKNKEKIGANAILSVSLAIARASANSQNILLSQYLFNKYRNLLGIKEMQMPVPMMNIINGGKHADNKIDIQEFMIMPVGASSIAEAVRIGAEIFHHLKSLLKKGGHNTNVGDEGGFAPDFKSSKQALDFIGEAVNKSGYKLGTEVFLALDSASSEFYSDNQYNLDGENLRLSSDQMIAYYQDLINQYPIVSIEDALAENDYNGWKNLTLALGKKIQLVGDDLFVTNPEVLKMGIENRLANAMLVKFNQIGTLTETIDAIAMANNAGYKNIISHRSGETEDATIAHIAVATGAGQIKTGSLCRSDRTAKYNELIRIESSFLQSGVAINYAGRSILL